MADESFSPETHRFAEARYFEPVYAGDTLYPMLTITGLEPGRTTGVVAMRVTIHDQDKELVMDGLHRYLLRRKP
jgi:acyl dehydratase